MARPSGLTVPENEAVLVPTFGGDPAPPVGEEPTPIVFVGGSSRLKYVDCPGCSAGEKLTVPPLSFVLTLENQVVGPS